LGNYALEEYKEEIFCQDIHFEADKNPSAEVNAETFLKLNGREMEH
jgi:hypothetical protein